MKVLLINPPMSFRVEVYSALAMKAPPLGLAYLAAVLENAGYDVNIVDASALGVGFYYIKDRVTRDHPDLVGVTSTTPTIGDALKTVRIVKEVSPRSITVMGGPHVSFLPVETLKESSDLDVVCIGEGERTIVELARVIERGGGLQGVKGIAYRHDGRITLNEPRELIVNLDDLPFPARHLLPMDEYSVLGKRYSVGSMITSRGCPFQCVFCSSSLLFGKKFRARSGENVVDEMDHLKRNYKADYIEFLDDTFTLDKRRVVGICNEIIERSLDVRWVCSSRVDTISRELMQKMKKAGCTTIYFGVESGSQRVLNLLKKRIKIQQAVKAIKWAKELGIETVAAFIIGMLGETKEEINKTIRFAKKLDPDYAQFSVATPYPGTELFVKARELGLIDVEDWSKYTVLRPVMRMKEYSARELEKFLRKAYRVFYLRPSFMFRQIKKKHFSLFKLVFKSYIFGRGRSL